MAIQCSHSCGAQCPPAAVSQLTVPPRSCVTAPPAVSLVKHLAKGKAATLVAPLTTVRPFAASKHHGLPSFVLDAW